MPTTIPAMVPTGISPFFEAGAATVAGNVDCGVINRDDPELVKDAVDKLVLLAVLRAAVAKDVVVDEASLMLK